MSGGMCNLCDRGSHTRVCPRSDVQSLHTRVCCWAVLSPIRGGASRARDRTRRARITGHREGEHDDTESVRLGEGLVR